MLIDYIQSNKFALPMYRNARIHHHVMVKKYGYDDFKAGKIEADVLKVDLTKPQINVEVTEHPVKLKDDGLVNQTLRTRATNVDC